MAKLVRVADQLKAFEVGKSSGDASPKDSPPVTDASSKTKENQITKGSRSNRLAEIFRISKLRRLSGAPRSDPVSPEQKHPDGESGPPGVPDFVLCLQIVMVLISISHICGFSNLLFGRSVTESPTLCQGEKTTFSMVP